MIARKISLAVLALGLINAATAGSYTAAGCTATGLSIPCEATAWDVGFEAFWMRGVSAGNNGYAYTDEVVEAYPSQNEEPGAAKRTNGKEHIIDSDYRFGFELNASYHFNTGNDVVVSWEQADNRDSSAVDLLKSTPSQDYAYATPLVGYIGEHVNGNAAPTLGGIIVDKINTLGAGESDDLVLSTKEANGTFEYDVDVINVEFGQQIDVGADYNLRIHAGLQYAELNAVKSAKFATAGTVTTTTTTETEVVGPNNEAVTITTTSSSASKLMNTFNSRQESDFDGFGIRVGADAAYNLVDNVRLVGHVAGSLLFGDIDSKTAVRNTLADLTAGTTNIDAIDHSSSLDSVVVPAMMAKAGLNYHMNAMDGDFSLEGGWRFEGYYNAVRFDTTSHANNFTMSGPYAAVKYVS